MAAEPEILLAVPTELRNPGALLPPRPASQPATHFAALKGRRVTLAGGEPTLWASLPQAVQALGGDIGIETDGWALSERVLQQMESWGLRRIRVGLHGPSSDLHDWLTGEPRGFSRALKGLRRATALGFVTGLHVRIARPSVSLLPSIVALAVRERVAEVAFEVLHPRATTEPVARVPRLGPLRPALDSAVQLAVDAGLDVSVRGLPRCFRPAGLTRRALWANVDRLQGVARCSTCDPSVCDGLDGTYVDWFGALELRAGARVGVPFTHPPEEVPQSRAGRAPSISLTTARTRLTSAAPSAVPSLLVVERAATTRGSRIRLVRSAQERPDVLYLGPDWLRGPHAADLVRDAFRLQPPVLWIGGPLDDLVGLPRRFFGRRLDRGVRFRIDGLRTEPVSPELQKLLDWLEKQGAQVRLWEPQELPAPQAAHQHWVLDDARGLVQRVTAPHDPLAWAPAWPDAPTSDAS